jgi:hypothetical protein
MIYRFSSFPEKSPINKYIHEPPHERVIIETASQSLDDLVHTFTRFLQANGFSWVSELQIVRTDERQCDNCADFKAGQIDGESE